MCWRVAICTAVVVVVTLMMPKKEMFQLNEIAGKNGIASFIMAVTNGVTSSIFSEFGPHHKITDATGEPTPTPTPTQTLAVSNVEDLDKKPELLQILQVW